MSTTVEFQDQEDFTKAMAECRSDNIDTNWLLVRHFDGNPNVVILGGFGNGGTEELKEALENDSVMYGLVRIDEQFDQSNTVKFVYIHWIGKEVPFTKRGRFGIVHGSVKENFEPYHVTVETDNPADLDQEVLMNKVAETSGTKSKVLDVTEASERKADRGFTGREARGGGKKVTGGFSGMQRSTRTTMEFDDGVVSAASDVRSDSTDTNWFVAGYQDGNPKSPLVSLGSGTDGIAGVHSVLQDDMVGYSLCRVTDVVDDISTVKFVYIQWVGDHVKPMVRAQISTHKADLEEIFHPAHVTIFANATEDISESEIMDKVQSSSGSKSHVRNE